MQTTGLDWGMKPCVIESATPSDGVIALTGNFDMAPNVTILRDYGNSLFFPVVPLEMLHTDTQTPEIMVTIDGM
jgi:hypothetical protein